MPETIRYSPFSFLFRSTLVRRNNRNFARLAYEVFYLALRNLSFYEFANYDMLITTLTLRFTSFRA
jgi:hypothetical protein